MRQANKCPVSQDNSHRDPATLSLSKDNGLNYQCKNYILHRKSIGKLLIAHEIKKQDCLFEIMKVFKNFDSKGGKIRFKSAHQKI